VTFRPALAVALTAMSLALATPRTGHAQSPEGSDTLSRGAVAESLKVLAALGPEGILINMSRGSVVDEEALIKALQDKTILSAGLDVYLREPEVPPELIAMEHVVLFPHLGSASAATRAKMDQLVVDNLLAWAAGNPPLTPVPETPWQPKPRS